MGKAMSKEEVAGAEMKLNCTQTDSSLFPLKNTPNPSMIGPKS